jgi:hypothetical protein
VSLPLYLIHIKHIAIRSTRDQRLIHKQSPQAKATLHTETSAVSTSSTTMTDHFRFLDLPGGVRNMIYSLALPYSRPEDKRPVIGPTTNLMRVCRQVYQESTSFVYGGDTAHEVTFHSKGEVSFLGERYRLEVVFNTDFSAINHLRSIKIHVNAGYIDYGQDNHYYAMQDAMFHFFGYLKEAHQLHKLAVHIDVTLPSGGLRVKEFETDSKRVKDRKPPRAEIGTFLADPLRIIRLKPEQGKQGIFTLDLAGGENGRLW